MPKRDTAHIIPPWKDAVTTHSVLQHREAVGMIMDLQFISITNPKDVSVGETRKLVRSQAMRHFRHRQRQNMLSDTSLPDDQPMSFKKKQFYRPTGISFLRSLNKPDSPGEDEDEPDVMQGRSSSSAALFFATITPQFELFPVCSPQKSIYKIFDHYSAAVAGGFLPLGKFVSSNPFRTRILPLVTRDAALYHTILANASMDMIVWRQEQFFDPVHNSSVEGTTRGTVFCTRHKLEGIRAINAKLNDPKLSISDETILAVCHLAGLEMLASATKKPQERYNEVKIHLDGLEQMLKLRGGLRVFGWNTCLTQMILRIDHLYSALSGAKPRFSANDLCDTNPDMSTELRNMTPGLPAGTISPELENIILRLRDASDFLEALENPVSENDFFLFGIKRIRIEDSLFGLGTSPVTYQSTSLTQIDQCCRFASVLYVQTVLTKVNCKVYRSLVTALRRNLEQTDIKHLDEEAPGLLLWMLLAGGGAAPFNEDRSWFLENLVIFLRSDLWSEVVERLQGWPWRPKYCSSWRMVWRNAVIKRGACSDAGSMPHG